MKLPIEHEHVIDLEKIKRDAFVLLNLGYGFLRLRDDDEGDVNARESAYIFQSYGKLYSQETSSILTSISIAGRMFDDMIKRRSNGIPASTWDFEDVLGDDENGEFLSLRDCFNKVIHAEQIDHELLQLPEVYLRGKKQCGKDWTVRIFVLPFCASVFQWIEENQV